MFLAPLGAAITAFGAGAAGLSAAAVGGGVATAGTAALVGAGATTAAILTAGATGAGIYSAFNSSRQTSQAQLPSPQQPPPAPNYTAIQAQETQNILRANQKRTKTILTNPLGETTGFTAQKKQLVGKLGL